MTPLHLLFDENGLIEQEVLDKYLSKLGYDDLWAMIYAAGGIDIQDMAI